MRHARASACYELNEIVRPRTVAATRIAFIMFASFGLSACEQNSFVAPPPPKVDVAVPAQGSFTRYLEATGNTAPVKNVDLVARVQGFLQSIEYKDGAFVREGTPLFTIEPDTYKLKLEQAQAAETGAQATLKQAEADFKRQQDLVQRQAVSQATLDNSTSTRDNAQANLLQAQVNTKIAAVNYGYTHVAAPFDGVVSAHLVSVGELVGASSPTQLATIVALNPIWVNFNVNELDVLRVRGVLANADRALLPGFFVRVRVPIDQEQNALFVPDVALGADQAGRYLLVVNGENVVEQRNVRVGPLQEGGLRVIEEGLKADDRVVTAGLLRAIPGQKVDPQLKKIEAQPAAAK